MLARARTSLPRRAAGEPTPPVTGACADRWLGSIRPVGGSIVMVVLCGCRGPQSMLDPAGPAASGIAELWWLMFGGACLVFALLMLLLWHALRARRRFTERAAHGLIVGAGIVVPGLLLAGLVTFGIQRQTAITLLEAEHPVVIHVLARRWAWEFSYPQSARPERRFRNEVVLPLGRTVEFHLYSEDVIHSFWIPRLGGKMDVIPGRINRLRLQAGHKDVGFGQCAEFCGRDHAHMKFAVQVLDAEDFEAWRSAGAGSDAGP